MYFERLMRQVVLLFLLEQDGNNVKIMLGIDFIEREMYASAYQL